MDRRAPLRGVVSGAAATVLAAVLLTGCSGSPEAGGASGTGASTGTVGATGGGASATGTGATPSSGSGTGPARPAASGSGQLPVETGSPSVAVASLTPVRIGTAARPSQGVTVVVDGVRSVQVAAKGPGEIAGPGVSVQVAVTNGTDKPVDLGGVVVNATYGKGTPAVASTAAPARALSGPLAAGRTATGVYLFTLPRAQVSSLRVDVSSDEWRNIAVFRR